MSKDVFFGEETHRMFKGVQKLARAVKSTLGPTGRNVVIKNKNSEPFITKDGVTVAREIAFKDPLENTGAELIRNAANRTADLAGDGTTTATVLTEAILDSGKKFLDSSVNITDLKEGIDSAADQVLEKLDVLAKPVTSLSDKINVATISANNDSVMGKLLGELVHDVGADGMIAIEENSIPETQVERVNGFQINSGLIDPRFATEGDKAVLEEPLILVYDGRLSSAREIATGDGSGFVERVITTGKPLVIIADGFDGEVFNSILSNKLRSGFKLLLINSPFLQNKIEFLEDLALSVGTKIFSKKSGTNLNKISDLNQLGSAEKLICSPDKTIIIGGNRDIDKFNKVNEFLTDKIKDESDSKHLFYKERLSRLHNNIAIVKVGGESKVEVGEKRDRVEDALYATQAAVKHGILPGGGVALLRCYEDILFFSDSLKNKDQALGAKILAEALKSPILQIVKNSDRSGEAVIEKILKDKNPWFGYNAKTRKFGDLAAQGVIDPLKVTKTAITSAKSAASMFLTTDVVILEDESSS